MKFFCWDVLRSRTVIIHCSRFTPTFLYQKGWGEARAMYDNRPGPEHIPTEKFHRLLNAATHLADHLAEAPVLLFACLKERSLPPQLAPRLARLAGSSLYPAV